MISRNPWGNFFTSGRNEFSLLPVWSSHPSSTRNHPTGKCASRKYFAPLIKRSSFSSLPREELFHVHQPMFSRIAGNFLFFRRFSGCPIWRIPAAQRDSKSAYGSSPNPTDISGMSPLSRGVE